MGVLSCCHATELLSQPHLFSLRSFVQCSGPSLQRSLLCSSFIGGVKLLLKGCTGEIETLSRARGGTGGTGGALSPGMVKAPWRRAALPMLHLLGETVALLKPAGNFPSFPMKHVFAEGSLGTASCKVSGWQRGSLWDLGAPTQVSFRSRALGNRGWPVYQGPLSQPWRY